MTVRGPIFCSFVNTLPLTFFNPMLSGADSVWVRARTPRGFTLVPNGDMLSLHRRAVLNR